MVDADVDGEMVCALDDTKGEAIPRQRSARGTEQVSTNLVGPLQPVILGHEVDARRIVDHVPHDLVHRVELEP